MGDEYRLIIMDEFDFEYQSCHKQDIIKFIQSMEDVSIEAIIPYMIILDIGRKDYKAVIGYLLYNKVPIDSAYYQVNNGMDLHKLCFNKDTYKE